MQLSLDHKFFVNHEFLEIKAAVCFLCKIISLGRTLYKDLRKLLIAANCFYWYQFSLDHEFFVNHEFFVIKAAVCFLCKIISLGRTLYKVLRKLPIFL